jgi:hypothetical protein
MSKKRKSKPPKPKPLSNLAALALAQHNTIEKQLDHYREHEAHRTIQTLERSRFRLEREHERSERFERLRERFLELAIANVPVLVSWWESTFKRRGCGARKCGGDTPTGGPPNAER